MYVRTYVCICILCIYIYIYIHEYINIWIYKYMNIWIYEYMNIHLCVRVSVILTYICVCTHLNIIVFDILDATFGRDCCWNELDGCLIIWEWCRTRHGDYLESLRLGASVSWLLPYFSVKSYLFTVWTISFIIAHYHVFE